MPYEPINFQDAPSTATPLNAATLNQLDQGIYEAHRALVGVDKYVTATTVALSPGWQTTDGISNTSNQIFYSKSGLVRSTAVYIVENPQNTTVLICKLPENLRPHYTVLGVAFAQIAGSSNIAPVTFSIEPNGDVLLPMLPQQSFTLIVDYTYFNAGLVSGN